MDSRYLATREDLLGLQMDIRNVQHTQSNHEERLSRIEKKQADDAALKSVWDSPFPGVLGGTPQHGPVQLPSQDIFEDLGEQGEHLLGSLHLGPAEEEPMRRGAASRANSVRFDESALQGSSWAGQNNRQPVDYVAPTMRSGSGSAGGGLMMERSLSHKSEGRHSSAGLSVYSHPSVASGRASSLGIDTNYGGTTGGASGGQADDSPVDYIEPPPGFFVLGTVPSIIRCWLTTEFASETLLFADVCSGAQKSTVEFALLKELDLLDAIQRESDGVYRASLPVYLAEAMPRPPTARTTIPSITANLEIVGMDQAEPTNEIHGSVRKGVGIFLGSDTLRAHSADILFSQNQMSIFSSDHAKFAVPFTRPDDDSVYRHICTTSMSPGKPRLNATAAPFVSQPTTQPTTPLGAPSQIIPTNGHVREDENTHKHDVEPVMGHDDLERHFGSHDDNHGDRHGDRHGPRRSPSLPPAKSASLPAPSESSGDFEKTTREGRSSDVNFKEIGGGSSVASSEGRRESAGGGIWGSWRHGSSGPGAENGHRETGPLSGYQPAGRSRSMKVLRPQKSGSASSAKTGAAYEPPPSRPSTMGGERRRSSQVGQGVERGSRGGTQRDERDDPEDQPLGEPREKREKGDRPDRPDRPDKGGRLPGKADKGDSGGGTNAGTRLDSRRSVNMGGHELRPLHTPRDSRGNPATLHSANPIGGASAFSWMNNTKRSTATAE